MFPSKSEKLAGDFLPIAIKIAKNVKDNEKWSALISHSFAMNGEVLSIANFHSNGK